MFLTQGFSRLPVPPSITTPFPLSSITSSSYTQWRTLSHNYQLFSLISSTQHSFEPLAYTYWPLLCVQNVSSPQNLDLNRTPAMIGLIAAFSGDFSHLAVHWNLQMIIFDEVVWRFGLLNWFNLQELQRMDGFGWIFGCRRTSGWWRVEYVFEGDTDCHSLKTKHYMGNNIGSVAFHPTYTVLCVLKMLFKRYIYIFYLCLIEWKELWLTLLR